MDRQKGGTAISFVQRHYGICYAEAVSTLLGGELGIAYPQRSEKCAEVKPFALPPANKNMHRVFAYLCKTRGIDRDVVSAFAKAHLIYEDAEYHNAVFVGLDSDGAPRHTHKRSTNSEGKTFRQNVEGSDPKHSFNYTGTDGGLYVFEAPIDLLSYISLYPSDWQAHSYVACCGTSIQPVLEQLRRQDIDSVYLCLDNDAAGQKAAQRMKAELYERGTYVEIVIPTLKDWNDDLRSSFVPVICFTCLSRIRLLIETFETRSIPFPRTSIISTTVTSAPLFAKHSTRSSPVADDNGLFPAHIYRKASVKHIGDHAVGCHDIAPSEVIDKSGDIGSYDLRARRADNEIRFLCRDQFFFGRRVQQHLDIFKPFDAAREVSYKIAHPELFWQVAYVRRAAAEMIVLIYKCDILKSYPARNMHVYWNCASKKCIGLTRPRYRNIYEDYAGGRQLNTLSQKLYIC